MRLIKKIIFIFIILKFSKVKRDLVLNDLNFRRLDFTNYKQIKTFIFKKNFFRLNNRYVESFDFLNFSKNLGGKIGINLSKQSILSWYYENKNKINYPWNGDFTAKRLINILYNYEFINSSSTINETKVLKKLIYLHIQRVILDIRIKNINEVSSYDLIANIISHILLKKNYLKSLMLVDLIINKQVDALGMHKSYNILSHAKFLNNMYEIKNILLYFKIHVPKNIEENLIKMTSVLNQYFHMDGSIPLFNGANNNYTKLIYNSLNKEEYLKSRSFINIKNGLAFYSDKKKKLFFDVIQPNNDKISKNLSAGTLSFEFSCLGEKIISNCGASESLGRNPEYLRYSAAHSTIILQNTNISEIKEGNPHIKFPQAVTFETNATNTRTFLEGSHNGYARKFNKVIKRKLIIEKEKEKIQGEDTIISIRNSNDRIIYHIRFHLVSGLVYNFTNNKKNIILKTKLNNMYVFKSDVELIVEDSILVDKNTTIPTKQIVIKGVTNQSKQIRKWTLEKI